MESVKSKTPNKERLQTNADTVVDLSDVQRKVEAGDSVIDISQLSNGGDLHGDVSRSESMDMLSGSPEGEAAPSETSWMKSRIRPTLSDEEKKKIAALIDDITQLSDVEKLYLYLQLPTGTPADAEAAKQKCPGNPLGKKADAEVVQTYTWIQSHLEEDSDTSLPKQEVYEEYRNFFEKNKVEPLCAADFGKVMKHVFPSVRPRRLGTRGNSRYCYSGLRKKSEMRTPQLPMLSVGDDEASRKDKGKGNEEEDDMSTAAWHLVLEWAEKLLARKFSTVKELAQHLVDSMFVDSCSAVACTTPLSSKTGNKGNQVACHARNAGKRREAQQQLQRKLQEKKKLCEQKKKVSEQREQRTLPDSDGTRSTRQSSSACQQRREMLSPGPELFPDPAYIKADPDASSETKLQTTPTGNNIIFVPTVQGLQLGCQHTAENQPCTLSSTCKYKRIQPKPTCRSAAAVFLQFSNEREVLSSVRAKSVIQCESEYISPSGGVVNVLAQICPPVMGNEGRMTEPVMKRHSGDTECQSRTRKKRCTGGSPNGGKMNGDELLPPSKEEMSVVHLEKEALKEYFGDGAYDTSLVEQLCRDELASNDAGLDAASEASVKVANSNSSLGKAVENKKAKLSQLRMLLERNLPGSYHRTESSALKRAESSVSSEAASFFADGADVPVQGGSSSHKNMPSARRKNNAWSPNETKAISIAKDESFSSLHPSSFQKFSDTQSCLPSIRSDSKQPPSAEGARVHCTTSSVPQSPGTRGRFFTPISPQTTPLPEALLCGMSTSSPILQTSDVHACADMVSVAVGTSSRPPSATNSPFVSPRGTPVPWTRSRHNSGQSSYGGTNRQTPFQAVDSGVSSVSGSPFVSPQATPVTAARIRHCSNYNCSKAVSFGSGYCPSRALPGSSAATQLVSPRSAPLSPMVGDCSTQTTGFTFPAVGETPTLLRSRHSSASSVAPPSPQSAPLSPTLVCGHASMCQVLPTVDEPSGINVADCGVGAPGSDTDSGISQQPISPDWMSLSTTKSSTDGYGYSLQSSHWLQTRQRHASGPVTNRKTLGSFNGGDSLSHEIQEYLKNASLTGNASVSANRSRSVPVHQMFMLQEELAHPFSNSGEVVEEGFSKSYPATPVVGQCFSFPATSQPQVSNPLAFVDQTVDTLAPQEDMFLSVAPEWNNNLEGEPAMKFGEDDDFDADLQSTLEDLKDCDEFSKFAKELDFTPENEDDMT